MKKLLLLLLLAGCTKTYTGTVKVTYQDGKVDTLNLPTCNLSIIDNGKLIQMYTWGDIVYATNVKSFSILKQEEIK